MNFYDKFIKIIKFVILFLKIANLLFYKRNNEIVKLFLILKNIF